MSVLVPASNGVDGALLHGSVESVGAAPQDLSIDAPSAVITAVSADRRDFVCQGHFKHGLSPCPAMEAISFFDTRVQVIHLSFLFLFNFLLVL